MEGIEQYLDKMRGYLKRGHDAPVEWISTKRARSSPFEMMREKSNITMPPEERIGRSSEQKNGEENDNFCQN